MAAFAALIAAGVYLRQADLQNKGLTWENRTAALQQIALSLADVCYQYDNVVTGQVLHSGGRNVTLVEETLVSMPLEKVKDFQNSLQPKINRMMIWTDLLRMWLSKSEMDTAMLFAGSLEYLGFAREGVPQRYENAQFYITRNSADCPIVLRAFLDAFNNGGEFHFEQPAGVQVTLKKYADLDADEKEVLNSGNGGLHPPPDFDGFHPPFAVDLPKAIDN
ncbi:hypothetical protein [Agrobacterium cavarae]|uniref:hypothetical protein n=1 Tax=Agrobacterium cavarae TaxID=2528239 RepID=UPI002FD8BB67